jgi:hypothetical protein
MTIRTLSVAAVALGLAPAFADVLYYAGDPNGLGGVVSGADGTPPDGFTVNTARLYDDFVVPAGGWKITGLGGNFLTETPTAFWLEYEIRTGVSEGVAGTLLYWGNLLPTVTPNGFNYPVPNGFSGTTGYYVELALSSLNEVPPGLRPGEYSHMVPIELGPGTYWMTLYWRNYITHPGTLPYLLPTSGDNRVGGPFSDVSLWDVPESGQNFANIIPDYGVDHHVDFSYRVLGTAGLSDVPEPGTGLLISTGLCAAVTACRRRHSTNR